MKFQRSDQSWIVSVRKKDFPLAAGRTNAPSDITIGTIHEKTGALDPWPVAFGAYGLATQSRNKPNEELWKQMALTKLKEAAASREFQLARRNYDIEESGTGDFIVKLSSGGKHPAGTRAFHDSRRAHDWAEEALKKMPAGSRAEFFRRLPKSLPPRTGVPWTEPFSALEVNEHGVVHMAGIRREKKSGDFQSSRPWVAFKQTPKGLRFLGRFVNEPRARSQARDEGGSIRHLRDLSIEERRQLGLLD